MARKKQENQEKKPLTRAQKTEATKGLVKETLAMHPTRHNELIEEVAKSYVSRYEADNENINDVKGRVGSVLDIMKKESEVMYDGGMYALKARMMAPPTAREDAQAPAPKKRGRAKKATTEETPAVVDAVALEEAPAPKKRGRAKKTTDKKAGAEQVEIPTPVENAEKEAMPLVLVEEKMEKIEKTEEKPAPKKRGRKPKAKTAPVETEAEGGVETPVEKIKAPAVEEKKEAPKAEIAVETVEAPTSTIATPAPVEEKGELVVKPKSEIAQKGVVMDMSFLFGEPKAPARKAEPRKEEKPAKIEKTEEKEVPVSAAKEETPVSAPQIEEKPIRESTEEKPASARKSPATKSTAKPFSETKPVAKPTAKTEAKTEATPTRRAQYPMRVRESRPLTADEKLCDAFLKRMRTLGGDYFEYYSVYLLERYCMKNGRRLEGLRISGGDHDGGIDGEIELTDRFGFKETIYIQSKNWDPEKGKEEYWVVGETLLQQFIGACACRQAKDGKQYARGIFVTTSRFTPDAKRILEDMSDKIVGYDGKDLYEAAKECEFGVIKKNGEWVLDEKLLSGSKAFFQMF